MNQEHFGKITLINGDCSVEMKQIPNESVDVILTDPPYLYLNHELDIPFDENEVFQEFKRIIKPDGFIILFGRGTSFYRWNTTLAEFGFKFKEEIIWNKSYCSSPVSSLSRVHETISIHTLKGGRVNKIRVPYLQMKKII